MPIWPSDIPPPKPAKLSYKFQLEYDGMEEAILEAEAQVERLEAEAADPALTSDHKRAATVYSKLKDGQARVTELYARWAEALNVVERWNGANGFIFFGKGGEVATNRLDDQEVSVLSLHLLQVALAYVNTHLLQSVLAGEEWMASMADEDFRTPTPLIHSHVNPYGTFELDMRRRLRLDAPVEHLVR